MCMHYVHVVYNFLGCDHSNVKRATGLSLRSTSYICILDSKLCEKGVWAYFIFCGQAVQGVMAQVSDVCSITLLEHVE